GDASPEFAARAERALPAPGGPDPEGTSRAPGGPPPALECRVQPARDDQELARDVPRLLRGEEEHGVADIAGHIDAAERDLAARDHGLRPRAVLFLRRQGQ